MTWLKVHSQYYRDLVIDEEALGSLPNDGNIADLLPNINVEENNDFVANINIDANDAPNEDNGDGPETQSASESRDSIQTQSASEAVTSQTTQSASEVSFMSTLSAPEARAQSEQYQEEPPNHFDSSVFPN